MAYKDLPIYCARHIDPVYGVSNDPYSPCHTCYQVLIERGCSREVINTFITERRQIEGAKNLGMATLQTTDVIQQRMGANDVRNGTSWSDGKENKNTIKELVAYYYNK